MTFLYSLVIALLISCAYAVIVVLQGSSENEFTDDVEIDFGAIEGDLSEYVRRQNEERQ